MSAIDLDSERDEDRALWNSVGELTALLPADWTLIVEHVVRRCPGA